MPRPPWLRTSVGMRADGCDADVRSDTPAHCGRPTDGIVIPKLGRVLGPESDTEIEVTFGGFASNDARGVTATADPARFLFDITRSPFQVPSAGCEPGLRNRSTTGLETSLALFRLDAASEDIFQGDTGVSVAPDMLNLTISRSDRITCACVSRLPGEPAACLIERVFHPAEPAAVHLMIAGRFRPPAPA